MRKMEEIEKYCAWYCSQAIDFDGSYEQVSLFYSNVRQIAKDCGWSNHRIVLRAISNNLKGRAKYVFEPIMMEYPTVHAFLMDICFKFETLPAFVDCLYRLKNLRRYPRESFFDFERKLDEFHHLAQYNPIIEGFRNPAEEKSFNSGIDHITINKYLENMRPHSAWLVQIRCPKTWGDAKILAREYARDEFHVVKDCSIERVDRAYHETVDSHQGISGSLSQVSYHRNEINRQPKAVIARRSSQEHSSNCHNFSDLKYQTHKIHTEQAIEPKSKKVVYDHESGESEINLSKATISSENIKIEEIQEFSIDKLAYEQCQVVFEAPLEVAIQNHSPFVEKAIVINVESESMHENLCIEISENSKNDPLCCTDLLNLHERIILAHDDTIEEPQVTENSQVNQSTHENNFCLNAKFENLCVPRVRKDPTELMRQSEIQSILLETRAGKNASMILSMNEIQSVNLHTSRMNDESSDSSISETIVASECQQELRDGEIDESMGCNDDIPQQSNLLQLAIVFAPLLIGAKLAIQKMQMIFLLQVQQVVFRKDDRLQNHAYILLKNRPPREKPPWILTFERSFHLSANLQGSIAQFQRTSGD